MGQTRVDLQHLLEDLRDAYPGALEDTILTEIVANALDSGASTLTLLTDAAEAVLVLVDDVALPVGRFRLRAGGSPGGHNGLKSVEAALRSGEYARLRIGVGPAPEGLDDLAEFVLDSFGPEERPALAALLDPMAEAVDAWLDEGIAAAMNRFNR